METFNELEILLEWMNENIEKYGYEHTYKRIKNSEQIKNIRLTNAIREQLMRYFKILLNKPKPNAEERKKKVANLRNNLRP